MLGEDGGDASVTQRVSTLSSPLLGLLCLSVWLSEDKLLHPVGGPPRTAPAGCLLPSADSVCLAISHTWCPQS